MKDKEAWHAAVRDNLATEQQEINLLKVIETKSAGKSLTLFSRRRIKPFLLNFYFSFCYSRQVGRYERRMGSGARWQNIRHLVNSECP